MKKILLFIHLLSAVTFAQAQTTATDFTVNDCDGNTHHLFSELESGKIIVLAWVMPCGGCIFPARSAYNVAQSYSVDFPGRVFFYMADDYANSSCSSIESWATSNNMSNCTFFSNNAISMSDYGTDGMPKIVVLGGADHKVYYNMNDFSDAPGVEAAIDSALAENPVSVADNDKLSRFEIFPNPVQEGSVNLSFTLSSDENVSVSVYDAMGKIIEVFSDYRLAQGQNTILLNTEHFPTGIYYVRINCGTAVLMNKLILQPLK